MDCVVDSSVLVAILNGEAKADDFLKVLQSSRRFIGWPTVLETRIWCLRKSPERMIWVDRFVASAETVTVNHDEALDQLATEAYERFGKGLHSAKLNFGDCMAYAVARFHNLPLLFKGNDFSQTDIKCHAASVAA